MVTLSDQKEELIMSSIYARPMEVMVLENKIDKVTIEFATRNNESVNVYNVNSDNSEGEFKIIIKDRGKVDFKIENAQAILLTDVLKNIDLIIKGQIDNTEELLGKDYAIVYYGVEVGNNLDVPMLKYIIENGQFYEWDENENHFVDEKIMLFHLNTISIIGDNYHYNNLGFVGIVDEK